MTWQINRPVLLLALCAFFVSVLPVEPKASPPTTVERLDYGNGRQVCQLANQEIIESSGIACSRLSAEVFWTHNDSGDRPRLFAFNRKGEDLGVLTVDGARATDWEDMASFQIGKQSFLVVGDIGDNKALRREYTIYVIAEPELDPTARSRRLTAAVVQTTSFTYEDGPHNCESLGVDVTDRKIYLVSKVSGNECMVYCFQLPAEAKPKTVIAKRIATLKIPTTTAMDISPDGLRAIVLTYGDAHEYVRKANETWAEGFSREGRVIPMPRRQQGESICYGHDGKTLFLTSEKLPTPLLEVLVK